MTFKEFIDYQESMTSTSCIAGFSRIALPLVRRVWPTEVEVTDEDGKKRKKKNPYKVPQIDEQARWRTDQNLRKIVNADARKRDDYDTRSTKFSRAELLQRAKRITGNDAALPGLTKWFDKLRYQKNPDNDTHNTVDAGQQPKHLYRGAASIEGLKKGWYANNPHNPIIHGSPFVNTGVSYSSPRPTNYGHQQGQVHATQFPALDGTGDEGGPTLLARFKGRPDQRFTYDPGLEKGEAGETPAELVSRGSTVGGGSETNLIRNKFDKYVIQRDRGVDKNGRWRPDVATVSDDKFDKVLKPNLKMI